VRPPRNPFRLRAAEQIEDDWTFLSLYEPGLLSCLPTDQLWDRRVIVRSSPGGGKTTMLRLFTPGPLQLLHTRGRDDTLIELYRALREREALDRHGPLVAGAMLSLAGKYAPLEHLSGLDEDQQMRAFLAVLNSRVLLAGLRPHLELAGYRYPDDLGRVHIRAPREGHGPNGLSLPADGSQVYEWARNLEITVTRALSSLGAPDAAALPGADELSALELLGRGGIELDGREVRARTLVMLDDVHRLSRRQREFLVDTLLSRRAPTPVWLAERREALTPDELLSLGSIEDRDEIIVDIEDFWRSPGHRGGFEGHVLHLADRRTRVSGEATSFAVMLRAPDDHEYAPILAAVERRLLEATEGRREFAAWVDSRLERHENARERAISLRTLQIQITRELSRQQMSFDLFVRDEAALDELDRRRETANVRGAAELFLCREFQLPYYYGPERLAQLASVNVDQFLELAGDLFEELSGASLLRRNPSLTPARQERLIELAVARLWERLGTGVPDANAVRGLLDGIGTYAQERTYEPNAPYAPGVTGVALRRSHAEELQMAMQGRPDSWEARLGRLLATLIAQNLVTVRPSEAKGQRWAVYYLNRALCVRYGLPLGLGGWQPVDAEELLAWSHGDRVRPGQGRLAA
jgi:hypothetical protein